MLTLICSNKLNRKRKPIDYTGEFTPIKNIFKVFLYMHMNIFSSMIMYEITPSGKKHLFKILPQGWTINIKIVILPYLKRLEVLTFC